MAEMIVRFEWDDEFGEKWLNKDNLALALFYSSYYMNPNSLKIEDITEDYLAFLKTTII